MGGGSETGRIRASRGHAAADDCEIARLREEIDVVDARLESLFEERMAAVARIAARKRARGACVFDAEREWEKLAAVASRADYRYADSTASFFEAVMGLSRRYQRLLIEKSLEASEECSGTRACSSAADGPIYGLVGRSLSHSYSPVLHALLGRYPYRLFEVEPDELESFVRGGSYAGLNVTIPYKEAVMPLCDELSPEARAIGCVNTIVRAPDGSLCGENTDYQGFSYMVDALGVRIAGAKALIVGAGGACKTVRAVLQDKGAREVAIVSRSLDGGIEAACRHYDADIVVNTTPVGMYPHCPASPIDLLPFCTTGETRQGRADGLSAVFDVVYNPVRTGLLLQAEKLRIPHAGGLSMLVAQAKRASELFQGTVLSDDIVEAAAACVERRMRNVVLIGMPGAGKSTIGSHIARRMGRRFVDVDEFVSAEAAASVEALFASQGEEAFRRLETEAIARLGCESGLVIACGGGVVTRPCNYDLLHQNATIVWVRRSLGLLAVGGRPITRAKGVEVLAQERYRLYEAWADTAIDNDGTVEDAATSAVDAVYAHMRKEQEQRWEMAENAQAARMRSW